MTGILKSISFSAYSQVRFQIGTITHVEAFTKARNPSYIVTVNFGDKQLKSSAQLPPNYPNLQQLFNKQVVSVTNLPPRKIAGFNSQCLIVGFPDAEHHVHLLNTRGREVAPGSHLHDKSPDTIQYETFAGADIRAGTVTEMRAMQSDPSSYFADVDFGPLGQREVVVVDIDEDIAREVKGTQIAVLVNLLKECIHDSESYPLSFDHQGKRVPFGVDAPVQNGVQLF